VSSKVWWILFLSQISFQIPVLYVSVKKNKTWNIVKRGRLSSLKSQHLKNIKYFHFILRIVDFYLFIYVFIFFPSLEALFFIYLFSLTVKWGRGQSQRDQYPICFWHERKNESRPWIRQSRIPLNQERPFTMWFGKTELLIAHHFLLIHSALLRKESI